MARSNYLSPSSIGVDSVTIGQAVAFYCVLAFALTITFSPLRVLQYAIPLMALIACLAAGRFSLPPNAPPYLVLIVAGLAYAPVTPLVGWQDLYLMLVGLTPFMFGHRYRLSWNQVFVGTAVLTALHLVINKASHGGFATIEFDPANSRSSFESTTSFVFGLLAVWAALERRWRHAFFALVLCVLTLKRIVVLATLVTLVLMLLPRRLVDLLLRPLPMILANALFLYLVIGYTQGHFDRLIAELTHQSANQLGMGRQSLYHFPVAYLVAHPWESVFYGIGPGGVYELMKNGWAFLSKANLHNDSLKILVEYGGIVWIAFFAAMYWNRDLRVRVVMLFLNIVFLTDNSLIYSYVTFAVALALMRLTASDVQPAPPPGAQATQSPPHPIRRAVPGFRR